MSHDLVMAGLNAAVCVLVALVCICRLSVSSKAVKASVRNHYVIWLAAALPSALSPVMFKEPVSAAQFIMGGAVLINLMVGSFRWRFGAPAEAMIKKLRDVDRVMQ